ncbi:MAG: hypothetical protein Q4F53_10205 [Nesterenkonia sp.]|nr:hypothetical protein [Nesterenkonia sp.]
MATAPQRTDGRYDVDVVQLSDFRLPGGTTSSIAEEVRAQSAAGITTALVHTAGNITNHPHPWSAHIRGVLDLPHVRVATHRDRLHTKLLVIRHPTVIWSTMATFDRISADEVVVVVNHAAVDAAGTRHYPVEETDRRVRDLFGRDPIWAPIGPVVRGTVLEQTTRVPLRESDWVNIFRVPDDLGTRTGFLGDRPIIGRHSRPEPGKWPATRRDIRAAYPDSEKYQVEILGGAWAAEKILRGRPEHWHVVPFGGEDPMRFLQRIDFWVYMHHPDLKEAFGRAAMEALAAGCVAVMPPYMEELFGDAALYATPQQVTGIVDALWKDPERFLAQSRRAQEFARSFTPQMHIERLGELGVHAPKTPPAEKELAVPRRLDGPTLVISTQEEAAATAAAVAEGLRTPRRGAAWVRIAERPTASGDSAAASDSASDSAGEAPTVRPDVEISSQAGFNTHHAAWSDYLGSRLTQLVGALQPGRVVVVGPTADDALVLAARRAGTSSFWVRPPGARELDEEAMTAARSFSRTFSPEEAEDLDTVLEGIVAQR